MKKLQNNFTTPEQSKRLLELGLPADSADMYQWNFDTRPYVRELECLEPDWFDRVMNAPGSKTSPVWSVGRLIEIIRECSTDYDTCKILVETLVIQTTDNVDALVELICFAKCDLDFSKLEE